jgi:hypothetical protein
MPVMNGPQLIYAMRADPRLAEIPVILMADRFSRPPPAIDPEVAVLAKPVMLPKLFALVDEAGRKRRRSS